MMLKKASNFVLGSKQSSTYPRGYASGCFFPAAALEDFFEHHPVYKFDGSRPRSKNEHTQSPVPAALLLGKWPVLAGLGQGGCN
ncbi:MAG: hypothetical protein M3Z35_03725 [Nitrospirota bacterium]|nr:hypothetical protein [Nitrospirota bacterium]